MPFYNSAEYWYFKQADCHTHSPNTKQIWRKDSKTVSKQVVVFYTIQIMGLDIFD